MTAPTEEQIRATIADEWPSGSTGGSYGSYRDTLRGVAIEAGEAVTNAGRVGDAGGLWEDISPALAGAIQRAAAVAARQCECLILEAMVAAVARYADEHPDAPRAL